MLLNFLGLILRFFLGLILRFLLLRHQILHLHLQHLNLLLKALIMRFEVPDIGPKAVNLTPETTLHIPHLPILQLNFLIAAFHLVYHALSLLLLILQNHVHLI